MQYFSEELFLRAIKENKDFQDMIETMKEEVNDFYNTFDEDYNRISGWGHNHFCDEDGGRLIYDKKKPHSHMCPICKKEYSGGKYDKAWVYIYRNNAFSNSIKASLLYKATKDNVYLDYFYKIIGYYSDNYAKFALHNKVGDVFENIESADWGCGKIQSQGLNESIIIIKLLNALEIVKDDLDKKFVTDLYNNFFINAVEMLKPQVDKIHNIPTWNNCAIGSIGLMFDNKEMIDFAFKGEFNIDRQLEKGVTEDYFWYEGSIHYNFFTLEGVFNLALFAKAYNYEFKHLDIIEKMLISAYNLAFDSHILPNPNDGWPNLNLKTYSYVYCMGAKLFGENSVVANLFKNIQNKNSVRFDVPLSKPYYYNNRICIEQLFLVPTMDISDYEEVKVDSINFSKSQFANIKNDIFNIFCKYGHNGPSHAHPDKMNIEVMVQNKILSKDLSNAGYGSKLCNEWHRTTASHNTVVVDGENQISMERGSVISFDRNSIEVSATDIYGINKEISVQTLLKTMNEDEVIKYLKEKLLLDDSTVSNIINGTDNITNYLTNFQKIDFNRKLRIDENVFEDIFEVKSAKDKICDYFFHSEAKLLTELQTEEAELGFSENGYQHISKVKKVITEADKIILNWDLDGIEILSEISLDNLELFIAETFDNPTDRTRISLILRGDKEVNIYKIVWTKK